MEGLLLVAAAVVVVLGLCFLLLFVFFVVVVVFALFSCSYLYFATERLNASPVSVGLSRMEKRIVSTSLPAHAEIAGLVGWEGGAEE